MVSTAPLHRGWQEGSLCLCPSARHPHSKFRFILTISLLYPPCDTLSHAHTECVCPNGLHSLTKIVQNPSKEQKAPSQSNAALSNQCNSKDLYSWYLPVWKRIRYRWQQPPFGTFLQFGDPSFHNGQVLGPTLQLWSHGAAPYFRQKQWICSQGSVLRTHPGVQEQNK